MATFSIEHKREQTRDSFFTEYNRIYVPILFRDLDDGILVKVK